jgi:hypothetical protein
MDLGDGQIAPHTRASSGASQSDQSMADADGNSNHEPVIKEVRMVGTPVSNSRKKGTRTIVVAGARRKSKRNANKDAGSDDDDDGSTKSTTTQRGKKQKVDQYTILHERFPGSDLLPQDHQDRFLEVMEHLEVATAAKVDHKSIPGLEVAIARFRADGLIALNTFGKSAAEAMSNLEGKGKAGKVVRSAVEAINALNAQRAGELAVTSTYIPPLTTHNREQWRVNSANAVAEAKKMGINLESRKLTVAEENYMALVLERSGEHDGRSRTRYASELKALMQTHRAETPAVLGYMKNITPPLLGSGSHKSSPKITPVHSPKHSHKDSKHKKKKKKDASSSEDEGSGEEGHHLGSDSTRSSDESSEDDDDRTFVAGEGIMEGYNRDFGYGALFAHLPSDDDADGENIAKEKKKSKSKKRSKSKKNSKTKSKKKSKSKSKKSSSSDHSSSDEEETKGKKGSKGKKANFVSIVMPAGRHGHSVRRLSCEFDSSSDESSSSSSSGNMQDILDEPGTVHVRYVAQGSGSSRSDNLAGGNPTMEPYKFGAGITPMLFIQRLNLHFKLCGTPSDQWVHRLVWLQTDQTMGHELSITNPRKAGEKHSDHHRRVALIFVERYTPTEVELRAHRSTLSDIKRTADENISDFIQRFQDAFYRGIHSGGSRVHGQTRPHSDRLLGDHHKSQSCVLC